jgi:hypothetical protein
MIYSATDKRNAAKALENARQKIRDLGSKATGTDRKAVADAEKHYDKVMGKKS